MFAAGLGRRTVTMVRPAVVVVVAFVLLCTSAVAAPRRAAEDPDKEAAKVAFVAGTKHYALNEYALALEKFKDAFRIFPDPSILFNIAQCQRQLNQKDEAVRSYKSFLRNAGATPVRDEVQSTIAKLEAELAEERAKAEAEASRARQEAADRAAREAQATVTISTTATATPTRPVYKRGWFWGVVVGAVVVVGVGVGLGVGLTRDRVAYPNINAADGTYRF